jgi:hypothetical protein
MKQVIITLLLAGLSATLINAQTPKYKFTTYTGPGSPYGGWFFHTADNKFQAIYYPPDFASMPAGQVSNVYLRVGKTYNTPHTITYHNFTIKLGYTADSSFPHYTSWDTFKTGLTTVYTAAATVFTGADTIANWIKIPCTSGNFVFNKTQKMVLEVSHKGETGGTSFPGFDWMSSNNGAPMRRSIGSYTDSVRAFNSSTTQIPDLGFDLVTTDVAALSNITSFGLFPNPATDGHFNVSFDAGQAVKTATVTVTNVTGQRVLRQAYSPAGNSFFKEIDMGAAAKGIYFVEVMADGERVVRRVIIQ